MTVHPNPRRDVERNHEAILTAAILVLANEPQATMADIARASGTGRSTLYRHFPDREALIDAIYKRVLAQAEGVGEASLVSATAETDPIGALTELIDALAGLGDRYRFLAHHEDSVLKDRYPETAQRLGGILRQLLAGGRQSGHIRTDLTEDWLLAMIGATITQAARHLGGETGRGNAVRATVRSLLSPAP
jgi:AcrR family transcriptional regulator